LALGQPNVLAMHPQSMQTQVERIVDAFHRLGIPPQGAFTNLDTLFAPPSPSPGTS
jgi:hypothetical protein